MRQLIYEIFFEGIGVFAVILFSIVYPVYKNKHFLSSEPKKRYSTKILYIPF